MDDEGQWLDELYRETGPHLLRYFLQRLGDTHAAEDLLQETFAAALRNPDRVRRAASARAYLFGIARNLAVSAHRRRHDTEPVPDDLAKEDAPADPKLALLREAIDRLKPEFREAIELRLQHELSYDEIAESLGVPVGTVRSRLHYAVNELRRALQHTDTDLAARKIDL
jgi:RNA polymerase sigma-70 factor, ECF subfamily